ncbi:hypothetical protein FVEG_03215 [Fusarium verticillioides 7600]|uniref:Uncharacterized protein n=1 Tax=Gibberella moniliformis (strain M3125 / FGSC 7600) TaxID=334819 RepID=W7M7Z0_GIBM7|nr:hypothetical protein FVEG_03215 [Fusarium verticillioides 7600]EWG41022.1 hypothetical protein FVEG_03215 [Fusarium verticillioides 7600]
MVSVSHAGFRFVDRSQSSVGSLTYTQRQLNTSSKNSALETKMDLVPLSSVPEYSGIHASSTSRIRDTTCLTEAKLFHSNDRNRSPSN